MTLYVVYGKRERAAVLANILVYIESDKANT